MSSSKDNLPKPKDIDVENLTFDNAKVKVDNHILYIKLIGSRDENNVILNNGPFGLYLTWSKQLFTLNKFAIDNWCARSALLGPPTIHNIFFHQQC